MNLIRNDSMPPYLGKRTSLKFPSGSHRDIFGNKFFEIETMIEMHSMNLNMISEQIFCLVNMIFITKFVIFYLKQGTQFALAKGSVEARKSSDFRWHCFIQLKFLIRFKLVPKGSVIRS